MALKLMNAKPQAFQSTTGMKKTVFEHFKPQEWYQDRQSGLTWYYLNGYLYQYDEGKREYRSFYIGYNENAFAGVRIVSYEDEVIVLLDRRLERFDRQGKWLSSLAYPRSKPDGIYDRTTQGENSLIIDEATDVFYLVQGYRILRIDWKRNEVKQSYPPGKTMRTLASLLSIRAICTLCCAATRMIVIGCKRKARLQG